MNIIQNMKELTTVAMCGKDINWQQFGHVRAVYNGDLVLFNYTSKAHYEGRWNWFETVSRGLILNWKTGEIVARPFDKFHNWLAGGHKSQGHIVSITEKMDGSLGILYRDNGKYKIATRGSFESEQAQWATEFLDTWHDLDDLPNEWTMLFEIIYPENRIVVDHGDEKALYLLAIRNRFTGECLSFYPDVYCVAHAGRFPTPKVFSFNSITDIMESADYLDANHEGYVVEFSDGQRFKFKGDKYIELHRIVTQLSFKRVLDAVKSGTYDQMVRVVPGRFLIDILAWRSQINCTVIRIKKDVEQAFEHAPKQNRKVFALWTQKHYQEISQYLFLRWENRDYTQRILEREF